MEQKCYIDEIVLELIKCPNHIRGIAKKLNTNQMNIFRKLKELSEENVVDFREDGKNKTYFLKKTIEAKTHILIAENYNLNKTLKKYPILRGTIEKLQSNENVKMAVLFGSYAKGIAKRDSDVDVYIETDDKNLRQEMESLNSKLSVKIGKFDISSLLIKEIIKNHVIIKGAEEFYEKTRFFD
jgi:predicted nucleotidyltransferase